MPLEVVSEIVASTKSFGSLAEFTAPCLWIVRVCSSISSVFGFSAHADEYRHYSLVIMPLQMFLPGIALAVALGVFTPMPVRWGLGDLEAFLEGRKLSSHLLRLGSATLARICFRKALL